MSDELCLTRSILYAARDNLFKTSMKMFTYVVLNIDFVKLKMLNTTYNARFHKIWSINKIITVSQPFLWRNPII